MYVGLRVGSKESLKDCPRKINAANLPELQVALTISASGHQANQLIDDIERVQVGQLYGRSFGDLAGTFF